MGTMCSQTCEQYLKEVWANVSLTLLKATVTDENKLALILNDHDSPTAASEYGLLDKSQDTFRAWVLGAGPTRGKL